ncbi:MAG: hypothetical protein R3275_01795 [Saprospiraceae bacterium]|nr:hypothetical protein [Saprospiraceae bacterium]
MKNIFVVVLLVLVCGGLSGQPGFSFKAGVGTMITNDSEFTRSGTAHYGWRAAAYARLGGGDTWYFNPGLSYETYHLMTSEEFNAFESEPMLHFAKAYVNLAYYLIHTRAFKMRLSGGGNLNYLASMDDNQHNISISRFNDATLGVNGLVGFDFWVITLDVGYDRSLTDFFHEADDSTSQFWTLSAGFFF